MHKCPRCGAVCSCEWFEPKHYPCEHECESWTGEQAPEDRMLAGYLEAEEPRDQLDMDPFAQFKAGVRELDRERWRRGEFTDAELATLALFSAEHLDGEAWEDILDTQAVFELLEASDDSDSAPETDSESAEREGWERDL